jgi:small redox-active disulfide protein 2
MKSIKILGTGCDKCETLAARAREAADNLGQPYELEKISKVAEIMTYGVMMTPALVVDGEVKVVGKVPSVAELMGMLA